MPEFEIVRKNHVYLFNRQPFCRASISGRTAEIREAVAFAIMPIMKKALIILSVVLLAMQAMAFVGGRQRGVRSQLRGST
jgi:hypothetical protein